MNKLQLRIRDINQKIDAIGYSIKELEIRSELGYATIWRIRHYFKKPEDQRPKPRKTTLKALEFILGLDK